MFFMFKKLAEDKEKCVIYNRKHKMNELSTGLIFVIQNVHNN